MERAMLMADEQGRVDERHLRFLARGVGASGPQVTPALGTMRATLADLERAYIEQVLSQTNGNVDQAAAQLGISRSSLYNKIKRYGLASKI
jgi:transcriptional regulator with PAS, ATPase and Fis domain